MATAGAALNTYRLQLPVIADRRPPRESADRGMAVLQLPEQIKPTPEIGSALDQALERYNAQLPKLQEFILPAGTRGAAQAHVCRTVARRAERSVVALGFEEAINDAPRQFLNRLSDLMFVLARVLNRLHGGDDVYWKSERIRSGA